MKMSRRERLENTSTKSLCFDLSDLGIAMKAMKIADTMQFNTGIELRR